MADLKIVEGTGSATTGRKVTAKVIEEAMAKAIKDARAAGVTDPKEIRRVMMAARERIKQDAG